MSTVVMVAVIALPAAVILRLGIGAVLLLRGSFRARSGLSAMRTSPQVFAQRAGWTYDERGSFEIRRPSGYPFDSGSGSGSDIRHVLRGSLNGYRMDVFQFHPHDPTPARGAVEGAAVPSFNVWVVDLPQSLPTIGITAQHANTITADDRDYSEALTAPAFNRVLQKHRSLAWRIEGDILVSWESASEYAPDDLMKHAKTLTELADAIDTATWEKYGSKKLK
ncbi:MAG: hypothetical protein ACRDP6_37075 [Actinoallomurus sp.]